jgi:hypothetical protein
VRQSSVMSNSPAHGHAAVEPGRAIVVPHSARVDRGHENNSAHDARVQCMIVLAPVGDPEQQRIRVRLPNWLRLTLQYSGSNHGFGDQLPAQVDVPVQFEAGTRRIVGMDVDATAVELGRFQEIARHWWLETEAPLATARHVVAAPRAGLRGAKSLLSTWRTAARDLKDDLSGANDGKPLKPSLSPKEVEQARKSAVQQGHYYARNPQAREKARASALSVAPEWAAGLKGGVRHPVDVEAWVMMQEVSGILSPEEAAEFRRDAGLA